MTTLLLASARPVYTAIHQTDARGALLRGLKEYVEDLVWNAEGGRQMKFFKVRDGWAEPEQTVKFPSAAVYTVTPGAYEGAGLTPTENPEDKVPDGRYVVSPATFTQDLVLETWTSDPQERMQLGALLEEALNPVLYKYGFTLMVPHYFGQFASYALSDVFFDDSEEGAIRRHKVARYTVRAEIPVTRLVSLPLAKPRFELRDVGTEVLQRV